MNLAIDFPIIPINPQSKIIEERFYDELVNKAYDSISMPQLYVQQLPNVKSELEKPMSRRMSRFKQAGLIGCLDDSGVTSSNYKEIMYGSFK